MRNEAEIQKWKDDFIERTRSLIFWHQVHVLEMPFKTINRELIRLNKRFTKILEPFKDSIVLHHLKPHALNFLIGIAETKKVFDRIEARDKVRRKSLRPPRGRRPLPKTLCISLLRFLEHAKGDAAKLQILYEFLRVRGELETTINRDIENYVKGARSPKPGRPFELPSVESSHPTSRTQWANTLKNNLLRRLWSEKSGRAVKVFSPKQKREISAFLRTLRNQPLDFPDPDRFSPPDITAAKNSK